MYKSDRIFKMRSLAAPSVSHLSFTHKLTYLFTIINDNKLPSIYLYPRFLKISSSVCAVIGGVMLAAKLSISSYGFLFLALSSSQLFISSIQSKDYLMICYSGSIFIFVVC
jgi:hypothetical protein